MVVGTGTFRGAEDGGIFRQEAELILPTIEGWARAEAVLLVEWISPSCPVHEVEVTHFVFVERSAREEETSFNYHI